MSEASEVSAAREPRGGWGAVRWGEALAFGVLGLALCAVFVGVLVTLGIDSRQISLWGMLTPAIAAFMVVGWRQRGNGLGAVARATSMQPPPGARRTVVWCLIGLFLQAGAALLVVPLAAAIGLLELDLQNFSMLRETLAGIFPGQVAADGAGFPAWSPFLLWVLLQLAGSLAVIPLAFGEELGWRGYLVPALMPIGVGRMLVVSGIYWVLWHLPLLLYGGQFTDSVGEAVGYFALFVFTRAAPQVVVITWLRLASGSVWPAVLMHATSGLGFMVTTILSTAGTSLNPSFFEIGGQGLSLMNIVLGVFAIVLLATGQLRVRPGDPAIPTGYAHAGSQAPPPTTPDPQ